MNIKTIFENKKCFLTDNESTLLKMLEDDIYFENYIKKIRKKYNLKKFSKIDLSKVKEEFFHNLNKTLNPNKKLELISVDSDTEIFLLSIKLFFKYKNIPPNWEISFYIFIKYNVFPVFQKSEKIEVISGSELKDIFDDEIKKVLPKHRVYIEIKENLNKTELIDFIKKNFNTQIKPALEKTLVYKEKATLKNLSIIDTSKLINNLSKSKTSSQIADYINDKFNIALSDSRVRDIHSEYLKQIKNLRKN